LPAYGTDVRVGDLRTQFERAFATNPPVASDRLWTLTPALDVSETADSAVALPNHYGHDYITRVTPTLTGTIDSDRVKGSLTYDPTFEYYAIHGDQNGIIQNLNTNARATLVEDLLYADLRGYAASQPVYGGIAATSGSSGGRQNLVQTESFTAGPSLQKRYDDTAIVTAGYSVTRNLMTSLAAKGTVAPVAGLNSNYTAQQENAAIATGSDFGRIQASLSAAAQQYSGGGVYQGAHNETITAAAGYAVTRMLTVNGSIGHENIVYGAEGLAPIDDITWSGGVRLTPNEDSLINVSYGHQQGGTGLSFDGNYSATARLRLFARYSQGIGTGLQNLQAALANTIAGPAGVNVDRNTLAPVQLGNLLSQQAGVYRTTDASFTAAYQLERDTVSVALESTQRQLLTSNTGNGLGSNSGDNATLSWQHQLSETLTANTTVQYGTQTYPGAGGGSNDTYGATVSINYTISETLSTNGLISHTQTKGNTFGLAPTHDLAVIGLHKAF
jgi:uncharacterized protein (PEP-CTERM system associated)